MYALPVGVVEGRAAGVRDDRRVLLRPALLLGERVPEDGAIELAQAGGVGGLHGPGRYVAGRMDRPRFAPPLGLVVFVVGTCILGAEIAAARLLAPSFGASTIVWANTIGVVLVALSIGYWYGGRLADRDPTPRGPLPDRPAQRAAARARCPFVADPFLDVAVDALDSISAGAAAGLAHRRARARRRCPSSCSGAVAPYALRLAVTGVEEAGPDRRAALRDLHGRLAVRHVPERAAAHPAARHAPDVPRLRARARHRRRRRASRRARLDPRAGRRSPGSSRCRSGRSRATSTRASGSSTRPTPSTSTRASSSTPTAAATSSSTRARPSTR